LRAQCYKFKGVSQRHEEGTNYLWSFILEDNPVKPLRAVTKKKVGILPWVPVAKIWVLNEKVAIKCKALKWLMGLEKYGSIKN
jgi:hypothetical protein